MKKLLIAIGALAFLTSPLLAQGSDQGTTGQATGMQRPYVNKPAPRGPNTANDVYCNGQYVGSDPDPAIRLQMLKEFSPGAGGCDAN